MIEIDEYEVKKELTPKEIIEKKIHEAEMERLAIQFAHALHNEKDYFPVSYVYVAIANTFDDRDELLKDLQTCYDCEKIPDCDHMNEKFHDKRFTTSIKIGRSLHPLRRCKELNQDIEKGKGHSRPDDINQLDLWFYIEGHAQTEKALRQLFAEASKPIKKNGEYLTYEGYWYDWIDYFEDYFEGKLSMRNYQLDEKTWSGPFFAYYIVMENILKTIFKGEKNG